MNKYLVCISDGDNKLFQRLFTSAELFSRMDMSDCTSETVEWLYLVTDNGPVECKFYGTWCSLSTPFEPLRMEIRNAETKELYSYGYGTDH